MQDATEHLRRALSSDCGHSVEAALKRPKDIDTKLLLDQLTRKGTDDETRHRAIFLLGRLGRKDSAKPIAEALGRLSPGGKISALDALGRIGGAVARNALIKHLGDEVPQVRQFALIGLGRIGGRQAMTTLERVTKDDPERFVRETAQRELNILSRK